LQTELQDALLWFKVVVSIITGIVCGFHIDGAPGLIAGVAVVTGLSTLFLQSYLKVDDEAYGGMGSLLLDSAYVAFAAFLV
jgi:low affinity Fe/Cu permease